jgi:hypothetical protein
MWRGTRSFFCIDPKEPYLELHRSAWKGNSRKFGFRIVHKSPPESREHRFWGHSCRVREVYILWLCIDMRDLDFRER